MTDNSGNYRHAVELGWSGILEPAKTGYTFEPKEKILKNVTSNQEGIDFQAIPIPLTLSGKVTSGD